MTASNTLISKYFAYMQSLLKAVSGAEILRKTLQASRLQTKHRVNGSPLEQLKICGTLKITIATAKRKPSSITD